MDPLNYFEPNPYADIFVLSLYAITMTFIICINALFMWKAYRQFKKQQLPIFKQIFVRNYFLTMVSLFIMPLGSYIGNWVRFLTDFQYQIFSSENNFPAGLGYMFSIIFFLGYIGSILHSPFFQKRETVWNRAFKGSIILALILSFFMAGRFLLLGFQPVEFREATAGLTRLFVIIIDFFGLLLTLVACFFLYRERRVVTSQLKRAQMTIYIFFPIAMLGILVSIMSTFLLLALDILDLVILSGIPLYLFTNLAVLSLYYGMFTPKGFLIRMNVILEAEE